MVKRANKSKTENSTEDMVKNAENEIKEETTEPSNETSKKKADIGKKKGSKKIKLSKEEKSENAIKELEREKLEINDKFLRLYSEFDNFRKRTAKEKIELTKTASEDLISNLLPVIDDFERAIKSAEETESNDSMMEGMNLIYNKTIGILEKKGLKSIESRGEEFDTDYHEAITYIPSPSKDLKGKIVDEIEKGYMLGDKVIRYSKVVIGQ